MRAFALSGFILSLSIFGSLTATGLGISSIPPLVSAAMAQPSNTQNPYLGRVTKYRSDVDALVEKCDLEKMKALGVELSKLTKDLQYERKTNLEIFEVTGDINYQVKAKQIKEAVELAQLYRGTYLDACRRLDTSQPAAQPTIDAPKTAPESAQTSEAQKKSQWLLGDWSYKAWRGGTTNSVLRFRLEDDGTISAYLVSTTNEMAKKGYQSGMILMRGIRDTSNQINQRGSIWSHRADVAEIFSPRDPKRKPGQIYGQSQWLKGGVIFIERKTGELGGSTGFGNRLNWHRGKLLRSE